MNQDRYWELVSLKLSGEAEPSELAELESFIQENPEEGIRLEMVMNMWDVKPDSSLKTKEHFNKHMLRLTTHLSDRVLQYETPVLPDDEVMEVSTRRNKVRTIAWVSAIAAAVIFAIILIVVPVNKKVKNIGLAQNTVSTKRGSKSKISLPDGTQVWLNADSKIVYNENFLGQIREVSLSGEAFFDVVHDESRPFVIHTSSIDLKVLGTAFNVRSYAEEKNTETSLIRGSVEITLIKSVDKEKIILKPNEKLIVSNSEAPVIKTSDKVKSNSPVMTLGKVNYKEEEHSAVETLWTRNKLAFDGETLEDIALKIERWYDVKLVITDDKLKKEAYTGTFEDETLVEVLETLQEGGGFVYSINKKEVTISPRNKKQTN